MLDAFGLTGPAVPLPGGQATSWRVGAAVVKALDMEPSALRWQADLLRRLDRREDFRVSVPLRARDGSLVVSGWTSWRYEAGSHIARRWLDVIEVGRRLHAAVTSEPEPPLLRARTDNWSIGDRVAWGDLPVAPYANAHVLALSDALRPVDGRPQLIHGDLTGNVLFAKDLPPLVIDLSPYWRPPAFASAVVVADALVFEGAGPDLVQPLLGDPDFAQYLLRALIYRAVTDHLAQHRQRVRGNDPYGPAVRLAVELARSP